MTHQQLATVLARPTAETSTGSVIALLPPPRNALLDSARRMAANADPLTAANDDDGVQASLEALPATATDTVDTAPAETPPAAAPAMSVPPLGTQRARLRRSGAVVPSKRQRRKLQVTALSTATAISFSLTFMVAGLALLLGLVPAPSFAFVPELDIGVLMLFLPLCALTLAILFEVTRVIVRGIPEPTLRPAAATRRWHPGNGEG